MQDLRKQMHEYRKSGTPVIRTGFVVMRYQQLVDWARGNSVWPLSFGLACCGVELMHFIAARYDFDRFGFYRFTLFNRNFIRPKSAGA